MKNPKSTYFEEKAAEYLDRISDCYVYDSASGLYHHQSEKDKNQCTDKSRENNALSPFWVNVPRDRVVLRISIATLCAVFITVVFTGMQWLEANRSAKATERAVYESCRASQVSRGAFIESIQAAWDTHSASVANTYQTIVATKSEAAYVIPSTKESLEFIPGGPIQAAFQLKNIGKSAAKNVIFKARTVLVNTTATPPFVYPEGMTASVDTPRLQEGAGPIMGISNDILVPVRDGNATHIATADDLKDFSEGRKDVLVFARVTYEDSLGVRHWVQLCHTFPPIINRADKKQLHYECIHYNKEDSNSAMPTASSMPIVPVSVPEITCTAPKQ
ncbi:hypothetical protein [Acidicapsa ligni]|uniref:hypothetical protein n=1 Tax=Acidicapsa ligni TaxID=542300 RepID=UPI0021DF688B|nr:hypothetical protein [Acidicapsa ligni]